MRLSMDLYIYIKRKKTCMANKAKEHRKRCRSAIVKFNLHWVYLNC